MSLWLSDCLPKGEKLSFQEHNTLMMPSVRQIKIIHPQEEERETEIIKLPLIKIK